MPEGFVQTRECPTPAVPVALEDRVDRAEGLQEEPADQVRVVLVPDKEEEALQAQEQVELLE